MSTNFVGHSELNLLFSLMRDFAPVGHPIIDLKQLIGFFVAR